MSDVTITTTHDTQQFDLEEHHRLAAEQMGVDPAEISCSMAGPDSIETVSPDVFSEDGTLLKARVLAYVRSTTWSLRPTVQRDPEPEPYKQPDIPWPTLPISRGAKFQGLVTHAGVTAEHTFICDGSKLVLLDSDEGRAVIFAMQSEDVAHKADTGG